MGLYTSERNMFASVKFFYVDLFVWSGLIIWRSLILGDMVWDLSCCSNPVPYSICSLLFSARMSCFSSSVLLLPNYNDSGFPWLIPRISFCRRSNSCFLYFYIKIYSELLKLVLVVVDVLLVLLFLVSFDCFALFEALLILLNLLETNVHFELFSIFRSEKFKRISTAFFCFWGRLFSSLYPKEWSQDFSFPVTALSPFHLESSAP
jgi:hypothetical protein